VSRGPGRIERAIWALFDANPDGVFFTDELAEHCYPDAVIERKHMVAVLRAAWNVVERNPDWGVRWLAQRGRQFVWFNQASLTSTTLTYAPHEREVAKRRVEEYLTRRATVGVAALAGNAKALSVVRSLGNTFGAAGIKRMKFARLIGMHQQFAAEAANRLRALMVENDPDAVRAGLAEIAEALERLGGEPR
jgi:hypothetical protein